MITRFLLSLVLIVLLLPAFAMACSQAEIDVKGDSVVQKQDIPLLDASAPAITETATFALG